MTIRSFSPFLIPLAVLTLGGCDSRIAESKSKEKPSEPVVKTINRLATVKSPFLKRHETDPVDWFPWGPEAFEKAVAENKLMMVCVGYSSCPWTLKMQEESYKDPKVASFLNKNYVCVLVDREDRPDINNTYMRYSFLRNQKSGWPLHLWMTPKGLPLHTAIYLPAATGERTPSFFATVEHLQRNWQDDFAYVTREAGLRMEEYQKQLRLLRKGDGSSVLDRPMLDLAYDKLNSAFDPHNGGFSLAPKFHQAPTLEFLLEYSHNKRGGEFGRSERALQMVSTTLRHMAQGALQDQIGGGFHRYCQDAAWAVPQFEKMLFDQGILARIYLKTYQITKDPLCAEVAQRTFDYIESELTHPEGGFYCAENAFSESKTGKGWEREGGFYLWTLAEVQALVSPEIAQVLTQVFGLTESGNLPLEVLNIQQARFPKFNILRQVKPLEEVAKSLGKPLQEVTKLYQQGCDTMLQARRLRSRPLRDEKVLPSWNGSVISALAEAAGPLKQPSYLVRAEKAADYTLKKFLSEENPRPRFAEDYTMLIQSFLDLYTVTGSPKWLALSLDLQNRLDKELWDTQEGGYWDGPEDAHLFMRMKSSDEASEFAPNATGASNLVRFARITGNNQFMQRAAAIFQLVAGRASANPLAAVTASGPATHVRILSAYDQFSRPGLQFVINGSPTDPLVQELRATLLDHYRKHDCVLHLNGGDGEAVLLKLNPEIGKLRPAEGKPGVVVAQNFQAQKTFSTVQELKAFLDATY